MARISLDQVINKDFVNRFRGLASSGGGNSVAQALRGGGGAATVQDGLRLGARTFATSLSNLNSTFALANVARQRLEQLGDVTDKMLEVVDRATLISTSQQGRAALDRDFRKLANQFLKIVDNSKVSDKEFLTVEGLSEIFTNVGLDRETSDSIAAIFERFVTSKEDDSLASENIKGGRPINVTARAFRGPASDTSYLFNKVTDSGVTSGYASSAGTVTSDNDTVLNQNPAYRSVITYDNNGTVNAMRAGLLTTDTTLLAVNEATGYSVISSTQNFLGYNPSGYHQLYLVDETGAVKHQLTQAANSSKRFTEVDISSDNLTAIFKETDILIGGAAAAIRKVQVTGTIGDAPGTANTTSNIVTGISADASSHLRISDDGAYVAYKGATNRITMKDSSGFTDTYISTIASVSDFEFIDNDVLAIVKDNGMAPTTDDIIAARYGYGATIATFATGVKANAFDGLQRSSVRGQYSEIYQESDEDAASGFISTLNRVVEDTASDSISFYDTNGNLLNTVTDSIGSYTVEIMAVHENSGYTVISSQADLTGGVSIFTAPQLWLYDESGNLLHRYTSETSGSLSGYGEVELSEFGDYLTYVGHKGASYSVKHVLVGGFNGGGGAGNTVNTLDTGSGDIFRSLSMSNDGSHVAFVDTSDGSGRFYNADLELDDFLAGQTGVTALGFTDSDELVVVHTGPTDYDVERVTYGDDSYNDTLLRGVDVGTLETLEGAESTGYFAFKQSAGDDLLVYDNSGELVGSYSFDAADTVNSFNLAYDERGWIDIGVYGNIPAQDADNELFRLSSIGGYFAYDYNVDASTQRIGLVDVATEDSIATRDISATTDTVNEISLAYDSTGHAQVGITGTLRSQSGDTDREVYTMRYHERSSTGQKFERLSKEFSSLFGADASIRNRADAIRMQTDLKELRRQIKENVEAIDYAVGVIDANIELVRATGLAFLDLSQQLSGSEPETVARELARRIRAEAGPAMAQAENLQPLVVAALASEEKSK